MNSIHQIYCTHCTYGTSALHRAEGPMSDQVFEYSARAASVDGRSSHDLFKRIEQSLYFHLPGDLPGAEMLKLTAANCPWQRMLFHPRFNGCQFLTRICYRQTDTRGRPGSYFGHALVQEHVEERPPWRMRQALRLWNSEFWVSADTPDRQFDLAIVPAVDLLPGYGDSVGDETLWSFLTTPSAGEFHDAPAGSPRSVVPRRWREKVPEERQQFLRDLIHATLEVDVDKQERLVIAIEPSMAALLFYGISRFLPESGFSERLSCSTYESHLDRPLAVLTAVSFHDPQLSDLLPEVYRGRNYVRNTYRQHPPRKFRQPESRYASWVAETALRDGWSGLDELLTDLEWAGAREPADWETIAALQIDVEALLRGAKNVELRRGDAGLCAPVRERYASRVLARGIAAADPKLCQAIAQGPRAIEMLELVGGDPKLPNGRAAVVNLLRSLPATARTRFIESPAVDVAYKRLWLNSFVKRTGRLPELPALKRPVFWHIDGPLAEVLDLLEEPYLAELAKSLPPECLPGLIELLAHSADAKPDRRQLLKRLVETLDDEAIVELLSRSARQMLRVLPPPQPALDSRLRQVLQGLAEEPHVIQKKVRALEQGRDYLAEQQHRQIVREWSELMAAVAALAKAPPSSRSDPDLERAANVVVQRLPQLVSRVSSPRPWTKREFEVLFGLLHPTRQTALEIWARIQTAVVVRQLELLADDEQLASFLSSEESSQWLSHYPVEHPLLQKRVARMLDDLGAKPNQFFARVAGACAASGVIGRQDPHLAERISHFSSVLKSADGLGRVASISPKKLYALPDREIEPLAGQMADSLITAMRSTFGFDQVAQQIKNRSILEAIWRSIVPDEVPRLDDWPSANKFVMNRFRQRYKKMK